MNHEIHEAHEKAETLAEIVAEMRHGLDQSWHDIDREWAYSLADRIEAAAKRERAELEEYAKSKMLDGATIIDNRTGGNAAAMHEAVHAVYNSLCDHEIIYPKERWRLIEILDAALSAPPRNCDVGTAEEQAERWRDYCNDVTRGECPPSGGCKSCALYWAQMPYEAANESEAK